MSNTNPKLEMSEGFILSESKLSAIDDANDSSAGSLRAGQRVERKVRVGITVSHRRKEGARRLAVCAPV